MDEVVEAFCLVEEEWRICCFCLGDVRVSPDLRDSILSSSCGLLVVDFLLREWERARAVEGVCLVGEPEMVREEVVVDVGVSGLRSEVDGGLADSGGGGNGRGWWRVETIVLVEKSAACNG